MCDHDFRDRKSWVFRAEKKVADSKGYDGKREDGENNEKGDNNPRTTEEASPLRGLAGSFRSGGFIGRRRRRRAGFIVWDIDGVGFGTEACSGWVEGRSRIIDSRYHCGNRLVLDRNGNRNCEG